MLDRTWLTYKSGPSYRQEPGIHSFRPVYLRLSLPKIVFIPQAVDDEESLRNRDPDNIGQRAGKDRLPLPAMEVVLRSSQDGLERGVVSDTEGNYHLSHVIQIDEGRFKSTWAKWSAAKGCPSFQRSQCEESPNGSALMRCTLPPLCISIGAANPTKEWGATTPLLPVLAPHHYSQRSTAQRSKPKST